MSKFEYSLSDSDIQAITFALELFPSLELEGENEIQANINYQLCLSVGRKIIHHEPNISANEFRVVFCALQAVQLINSNDLDVEIDSDIKKQCNTYFFTVNKLVAALEPFLPKQ